MLMKVISPKNKYKDDQVYQDVENYCFMEKKIPNRYISIRNLSGNSIAKDMYELTKKFDKLKGTRIRHMVFSFDPATEPHITAKAAHNIAERICDYYQDWYQIYAVVHEDKQHLHIHAVMNTVNICNGEKYKGRKEDYYRFQKYLSKAIRPYGLHLEVEKST